MKLMLAKLIGIVIGVVLFSAVTRGYWLSNQYESIPATIVKTGYTRGLLHDKPWTLYKTPQGRIHRPGIWGEPGDKLIIQVKKYPRNIR